MYVDKNRARNPSKMTSIEGKPQGAAIWAKGLVRDVSTQRYATAY